MNNPIDFNSMSDDDFQAFNENGGKLPEQTKPEIGKPLVRTDAKGNKHITSVKGDKADYTNFNETGSQHEDLDLTNPLHAELAALRQANKGTLAEQHNSGTLYGHTGKVEHDPFRGDAPIHMRATAMLERLSDDEKTKMVEALNHGSTRRITDVGQAIDSIKMQDASQRVVDIINYGIDYVKNKKNK